MSAKITVTYENWNSDINRKVVKIFKNDIVPVAHNSLIHFEKEITSDILANMEKFESLENMHEEIKLFVSEKVYAFENEINWLLEAVVSTDVMLIILQTYGREDFEKLQTELSIKIVKYENSIKKLEKESIV